MHTYTLHNKCTHIHMHTTVHKEGKRFTSIGGMKKKKRAKFACRDLEEDLYSPQYPETNPQRPSVECASSLPHTSFQHVQVLSLDVRTDSLFEVDCSS